MSDYYNGGGRRGGGGGRKGGGRGGRGGRGGGRGRSSGRGKGRGNADQNAWVAGGEQEEEEDLILGPPQPGTVFGLPDDIIVPGTLNHGLLQGEILETLKRMTSDQISLVLSQFDTCAREGGIRNKSAYLLGIINSGPRMGLPAGVIVPSQVKFSLMHGVVLDDLNALPISLINKILTDFENQIRGEKGNTIQDRYSFMADLIRSHKKEAGVEDKPTPHRRQQQQQQNQFIITAAKEAMQQPSKQNGARMQHTSPTGSSREAQQSSTTEEEDETLTLLANSLERVNLLTANLAKVTSDLVSEKGKRSSMEAIAKSEKALREATEERLQSALGELAAEHEMLEKTRQEYETTLKYEQDRRVAAEKQVDALRENIKMEQLEKKQAEDRLSVLEEVLISERDVRDQERSSIHNIDLPNFDIDSDCESHD